MKIGQKIHEDNGKLVVETQHDWSPTLKEVEQINQQGITDVGDSKFVGRIPMALLTEWLKEAGVKMDDPHAVEDVIKKKILSGDFDKFRSDWRGTW